MDPTKAAEDAAAIRKRMDELATEKRRYDPNYAAGPDLDLVGERAGVKRSPGISDYAYRTLILKALAIPEE